MTVRVCPHLLLRPFAAAMGWIFAVAMAPPALADDLFGGDAGTPAGLSPQELKLRWSALDRQDPAVRYVDTLRKESRIWMGTGAGIVAATVLIGLAEITTPDDGTQGGPYIVATGMPLGIGAFVAGVPSLVLGEKYREWYAIHGPAPNRLARLKLTHRWELEEALYRRNTAAISAAVMGVCAILSGVIWGIRDGRELNGGGDRPYSGSDAYGTIVFSGATAAAGVLAVHFHRDLLQRRDHEHRLYAPTVRTAPMPGISIGPAAGGDEGPRGLAFRLGLSGRF